MSHRRRLSELATLAYSTLAGGGKRLRNEDREWYVQYRNPEDKQQQPWSRFNGDPVEALRSGEIAFAIRSAGAPSSTQAQR